MPSKAVETLDTYSSHLWPDSDDRTRGAIDAVLGLLRTLCGLAATSKHVCADQKPSADGLAHRPGRIPA